MASTDPGDDPPHWCFKQNAQGELPTCMYDGQKWHRTYESDDGPGMGSGDGGARRPGWR